MKFDELVVPQGQTITLSQAIKTMDVMINGFSIKKTVLEVIAPHMDAELAEKLAEEIKEVFATKMRLRQGM